MVNEVTIICMDSSRWMKDTKSYCFLRQIDAIEVYCKKYFESHPENLVGVLNMGGRNHRYDFDATAFVMYQAQVVVEPTKDLPLIMSRVRAFVNIGGDTFLVCALLRSSYDLITKHEHLLKRLVVFVGGPICDGDNKYTKIGITLKERGGAVDVVNFGDQQLGYKKHQLLVLLDAANNNDNTRMLDLCGHHLNASSIAPLVAGQGECSLYEVYLLQGEDLRTAKNQCDKVHGTDYAAIGYYFRVVNRDRDERRKRYKRIGDRGKLKVKDLEIEKDIPQDDDVGKERYLDRGDSFHDLKPDRGNDDTRKRKRDERCHVEGRERYRDRGDRYGRERYYRVGDRRELKIRDWDIGKYIPLDDDDDAGEERYWARGDSFHDLKPDGGNVDTRSQKRKRDDRGHDDERERYRDRVDHRYGRERYYRAHDDERGRD